MKFLLGLIALILTVVLLFVAAPYLSIFAVIFLALVLAGVAVALVFGAYYLLAAADRARAEADSIRLEASKVHADNAAVILNGQVVLLPGGELGHGIISNLHTFAPRIEAGIGIEPVQNRYSIEPIPAPIPPKATALIDLIHSGWMPTRERVLLGFAADGPLYGSIDDLLSTAIAGRPKVGKTTLLRFLAAQLILSGGKMVAIDPHGSLEDNGNLPAEWIASSVGELRDGAVWLVTELDKRLMEFRKGKRHFEPLMVMADEWPVISMQSKTTVEAIQRVILEARKTNYYGLISGQGLPASQFGGSLARDALSSRYIFRTTAHQARQAGLDKDTARLVEDLPPGVAIFEGPVNPVALAIPNVTGGDLQAMLRTRGQVGRDQSSCAQTYPQPQGTPRTIYLPAPTVRIDKREHLQSEGSNFTIPTRKVSNLETDLEKTVRLWREGHSSVRKLAAAWPCGTDKAQRLARMAREMGQI